MSIKPLELKEFVESNPKLVQRKESKRYPGLYVLKYTRKVFYDNLWEENKMLLECRGLVVDADYNVIVKPFTKIFNYGENGTTIPRDELCTVVRKVNGFMACATKRSELSDNLIISTTGSLDSEHVDIAARHIKDGWKHLLFEGETLIFEICDPEDPHIVTEEPGAYLIGGCNSYFPSPDGQFRSHTEAELDQLSCHMNDVKRPEVYTGLRFSDVVELSRKVTHEGFMVYGESGQGLKIKSPYYLMLKFIARMGEDRLRNMLLQGQIPQAMRNFDEEFYPLIKYIESVSACFIHLGEQDRIKLMAEFLTKESNNET